MLSIINENLVIIKDQFKNKNTILKNMVDLLHKQNRISNKNKFLKDILSQEKVHSTGIGGDIAIPHSRSDAVRIISVVIAICRKGVNFKALDRKPVKIIFMVAAPNALTQAYLQIIAKISRLLKSSQWRGKFEKAESNKQVVTLIRDFDKAYPDRLKLKLGDIERKIFKN